MTLLVLSAVGIFLAMLFIVKQQKALRKASLAAKQLRWRKNPGLAVGEYSVRPGIRCCVGRRLSKPEIWRIK